MRGHYKDDRNLRAMLRLMRSSHTFVDDPRIKHTVRRLLEVVQTLNGARQPLLSAPSRTLGFAGSTSRALRPCHMVRTLEVEEAHRPRPQRPVLACSGSFEAAFLP